MGQLQRIAITPKSSGLISVLHLTDLHFNCGTEIGEKPSPHLSRLEECLEQFPHGVDLVAVTGDIADNSKKTNRQRDHRDVLRKARTYLEALCSKLDVNPKEGLVVVPGNHDYRWFGNIPNQSAKQNFLEEFGGYFTHRAYSVKGHEVLFAVFDSIVEGRFHDLATGFVDHQQFVDLNKLIRDSPGLENNCFRVALVHHHPLPVSRSETGELQASASFWSWLADLKNGPQQFLMLKNAGRFIRGLLDNDIRLVLHGHMHNREYWRIHAHTTDWKVRPGLPFNQDRWIEVISGGSIGNPDPGQSRHFGIVQIHRSGQINAVNYGFTETTTDEPQTVQCASYEIARTKSRPVNGAIPVKCKAFVQTWDINLEDGNVASTKILRDLSATTDQEVCVLPLPTAGQGLALSGIVASSLNDGVAVKPLPSKPSEGVLPLHCLSIEPAIGKLSPKSLIVTCQYEGILFRSTEDQLAFGAPNTVHEKDGVSQSVLWPYEHLHVRVRFHHRDRELLPRNVFLEVIDPAGNECLHEAKTEHCLIEYCSPRILASMGIMTAPEATLTVYKPRLNYTYRVVWSLPTKDPISPRLRAKLDKARLRLRECDRTFKSQENAQTLIQAVRRRFQIKLESEPYCQCENELNAYLFAYDDRSHELSCVASTAPRGDLMHSTRFRYGRDIIGTAFRRHLPVTFNRAEFEEGGLLIDRLPNSVRHILACPINLDLGENAEWPVGAVALASSNDNSVLRHLEGHQDSIAALAAELVGIWHQWQGDRQI